MSCSPSKRKDREWFQNPSVLVAFAESTAREKRLVRTPGSPNHSRSWFWMLPLASSQGRAGQYLPPPHLAFPHWLQSHTNSTESTADQTCASELTVMSKNVDRGRARTVDIQFIRLTL